MVTFLRKIWAHFVYRLIRTIKTLVIKGCYRKQWEQSFFNQRLALLLVNCVFQKIFRLNGEVPWQVHFTSRVTFPDRINLGRNVAYSMLSSGSCYIQGMNGIEIGEDTIFAYGTKIISANHSADDFSKHLTMAPIRIGKRCWLGANAVILPGVQLGDDVVVGAGAVVTRDVPSGATVAGVPARVIQKKPH